MKIQQKQVLLAAVTFGYSGYKRAKQMLEKHSLTKRVLISEQILSFMLVFSILAGAGTILSIFVACAESFSSIPSLNEFLELEYPQNVIEAAALFPQCFIFFSLLHLLLGMALLQHTHGLKTGERAKVLWFGLYALDWDPMLYIKVKEREANSAAIK